MSIFNFGKFSTAALMTLAVLTSQNGPFTMISPAAAQLFPQQRTRIPQSTAITIPTGTSIPVRYNEAEKIVVSPQETMPLTLKVATNIVSRSGTVLIPGGSLVIGQLQPATGGSQFVARELVTYQEGIRQPLNASSDVIRTTQVRQGASTGSIVKGAVIGAAAAAALGALTGDKAIATEEVLIGTGLGTVGGIFLGRRTADVVVVDPDTDLDLTLSSSLALRL